ncbi:MAG: TIGR03960 family B12-binding radical SAM protein [Monoglobales bacterium]
MDKLLSKVQKAVRYTGGELGSIVKDKANVKVRFAFCFPDIYEIGMSHLGLKILYHGLNNRDDVWVERVFAPWTDMEEQMTETNTPLFGLESKDPIKDFDFVGFTLQYEMSYTTILHMLKLAGLPLVSSERTEGMPFVCAGGPCAFNPEPLADFMDFYLIGDGEEIWHEVIDEYESWKYAGEPRAEFLKRISRIEGIYVPSFYDVDYNEDGTIKCFKPKYDFVPEQVKKRVVRDFDKAYYPENMIVPYMDIVHDRIMLELFRGCIRGCRFCQAGFIYRPIRERRPETLLKFAEKLIENTGYEEISLTSLSSSDYTCLPELTEKLLELTNKSKINLALPSLRIDNFSVELMKKIQSVRKSSITFAPEAGTQRMRDVINKNITEEEILYGAGMAFEGGWTGIKLYFMIGLPTETDEDAAGIASLAEKVSDLYSEKAAPKDFRRGRITVSVSSFVPKPMTPFQWESQDGLDQLRRKQSIIRDGIKSRRIVYNWHESYVSVLEGVFSRGDRRLGKVLLYAHESGAKFDSWDEFFDFDKWTAAFEKAELDMDFYTKRKRSFDEILPWDVIDCGISKAFFKRECEKAYAGKTTDNCRQSCAGCGLMDRCEVKNG